MSFKTADISDAYHPNVQYVEPIFKNYGKLNKICGEVVTIKCYEDNSLVREAVAEDGRGKILVVDAGGSKRCAILGDMLTEKAVKNNWVGIVMYGLIRDVAEINIMNIGVFALGSLPLKSVKFGVGQRDIILSFAGVNFTTNSFLYADEDGIILMDKKI